MSTPKNITINLTDEDAEILAMIVKRFSYSDAERLACSNYPADYLISAIIALQCALRDADHAPR